MDSDMKLYESPIDEQEIVNKPIIQYSKIFIEAYHKLLNILDDRLTVANMVNVITNSIEIVDSYSNLTGLQKKTMVIKIITVLIDKHEDDEIIKDALINLLNTIGVALIDTIIYATKGKLAINLKKYSKLKCLKCL